MISGEVGNLVAYGDAGTAAVITAVGCVGVVANLFIATLFLKEPFRYRDLMGSCLVVGGVFLISIFGPEPEAPLTGDRLPAMISAPAPLPLRSSRRDSLLPAYHQEAWRPPRHLLPVALVADRRVHGDLEQASEYLIIKSIVGLSTGTFNDVLAERQQRHGLWRLYCVAGEAGVVDCTGKGFGDGVKWLTLQSTEDKASRAGREMGCYNIGLGS